MLVDGNHQLKTVGHLKDKIHSLFKQWFEVSINKANQNHIQDNPASEIAKKCVLFIKDVLLEQSSLVERNNFIGDLYL